jgi:hypothetical protein
MARSEARLQFGIWREGLEGRGAHAKLLYAVLLTEPTINHAGVGAIRLGKWARNASLTVEETEAALTELEASSHVSVDEDTDEILVRTMIRNDGVADQPYVLKGAIKEALQTESDALRRVLARELRKLPPKKPDGVSKAGKTVVYPDPHRAAEDLDPEGPPDKPKGSRDTPETLFGEPQKPSGATEKKGSQESFESLHGGGRGRGGGVPVPAHSSSEEKTPSATRLTGDRFREFYAAYPRRVKPLAAEKAWRAALRRGLAADMLIARATQYAESVRGKDLNYVSHPSTWLNAGAYDDENDLRLVAGGNSNGYKGAYQNPDDPGVWEEQL